MVEKVAIIDTDEAPRFVRMLCKHFAHKVEADWSDDSGWVAFAMGRCELLATSRHLRVCCRAENNADLDEVADTIKSHFDRFAQKQQLVMNWD